VDRPSKTWFGKTVKFAIGFPLLILFIALMAPIFFVAEAVCSVKDIWKTL
jgi:hypothetical protein